MYYVPVMAVGVQSLSGFKKFNLGLDDRWKVFAERRQTQLAQALRYGSIPEKVAEDILKDFFTIALDWKLSDVNNQVKYADMVLTHQGLKRLIVEVKRPTLQLDKPSLNRALDQAYRYAQEQRVSTIAVSDGGLLYVAQISNGGIEDRVTIRLDSLCPSPDLYWISVDGIKRPIEYLASEDKPNESHADNSTNSIEVFQEDKQILHPKHDRPSWCFAYVGNPLRTSTWKLPYLNADGSVDTGHLPGAIRAITGNYRGAHNKSVPESAVPDVLVRLGKAAWRAGKMPGQVPNPIESYQSLYDDLYQLDRLDEIK